MQQKFGTLSEFDVISLRLASPARILEWSHGEVTKPETINYRTQRSEKSGLFDEKIFGPERDYECYCGKYRGIRYKGIVCEKCGVELTRAIVRRERMGHITLATPVSHIWYLRGVPGRIALVLGIPASDVEKVIYFAGYIVTKVSEDEKQRLLKELDQEYKMKWKASQSDTDKEGLKERMLQTKSDINSLNPGKVLDEAQYHKFSVRYGTLFEAGVGAEAIHKIFLQLDLNKLVARLEEDKLKAGSLEREKIVKRLSLLRSMIQSGVRPEWMFMLHIPVMPPALRPMVALEGGRHATSDVNDLYRRVINRNNRLKKLLEINAPEVILRNEKRILQEAVDALIDNSIRRGNTMFSAMNQSQRRPLKSLSDYLKGKHGYFRQNLLGKRVDYSGRSVIVVGPDLKLDQCGLPKHMALELFRPFVIAKLLERELAFNVRGAGRLIEEGIPEVWAILEEVIRDKHVLLNRAPTLHRQGIQAFRPVLIEGNAIQIHPLVCRAFNADFDGDQMAVHVPLSSEAQLEAREIMSANMNIQKPGSGTPVVSEKMLDIVLGCYYMTRLLDGEKGEGKIFHTPNSAISAHDYGAVDYRAKIKVLGTSTKKYDHFGGKVFETSVGRLLFNSVLPKDYPFVNAEITQKMLASLVDDLIEKYGLDRISEIIDKIKAFGFRYATRSGITWGLDDITVPQEKKAILEKSRAQVAELTMQYENGLLSKDEKRRMAIEVWHQAKTEVEKLVKEALDPFGSVHDMVQSGARGTLGNLTMMAGMKGLIANTQGETIEFPILASMKEGLTPAEYFITTHGSRKGLADTALGTAKAGYLTRRLFDVAQDSIVLSEDCGTKQGILMTAQSASGIAISFAKNIRGRVLTEDVKDAAGTVITKKGTLLTMLEAQKIEKAGITKAMVRSPMTCETLHGVCQKCYGADLTTNELVDLGEAVGTVAAQAIGEPGTQLSMNTKHAGGSASVGGDITQGLPRVEEVFENRLPKNPAVIAHISGEITEIREEGREKIIVIAPDLDQKTAKKLRDFVEYLVPFRRMPLVAVGQRVARGQLLTDGSANIDELFEYAGKEITQNYIINETNKIYELQGVTISRKHLEVIAKQMFARFEIADPGDTQFSEGDIVEDWNLGESNAKVDARGGRKAEGKQVVLGITEVSLHRKSFLSAASFQYTTRTLISASVRGSIDHLTGLKENVIIGRLIPAGSGFKGSKKWESIDAMQKEEARDFVATQPASAPISLDGLAS